MGQEKNGQWLSPMDRFPTSNHSPGTNWYSRVPEPEKMNTSVPALSGSSTNPPSPSMVMRRSWFEPFCSYDRLAVNSYRSAWAKAVRPRPRRMVALECITLIALIVPGSSLHKSVNFQKINPLHFAIRVFCSPCHHAPRCRRRSDGFMLVG